MPVRKRKKSLGSTSLCDQSQRLRRGASGGIPGALEVIGIEDKTERSLPGSSAPMSWKTLAIWVKQAESLGIRFTQSPYSDSGIPISMHVSKTTMTHLRLIIEAYGDMRGLTPESMPTDA